MTDLAHTGRTIRAGVPSVIERIRRLRSRIAVVGRRRALLESASILLPILIVGLTHADGPALWLIAGAYLAASVAVIARMPNARPTSPLSLRPAAARDRVCAA